MHVVLMASVLVFSSIAGCLGNVDDDAEDRTVIVSTYHVEQIVSAIVGDTVNVEILAPSNVPVHDYEPTTKDLLRLQEADIFFYHGIGLETWIDATLDSLGDDAPDHFPTHAVSDGSATLLYSEVMIDTLCSDLSSPGTEDIHILHETMYFLDELHSDNAAYNMGMPDDHGHDEDHDGHDHDEDHDEDHDGHDHDEDHDGHDHDEDHDEDHDGHDHDEDHGDHEGHDHGEMEKMEVEKTFAGNADCPADTTISVYELEAGEYVLEFESEDAETFKFAIAAMGGAHHHHHGEEEGEEEAEEANGVCHDMSTHENHDEYTTEAACEEAGHMWMEEEHEMSGEEMLEMGDANNDSMLDSTEFLALMEMFEDEDGEEDHDHDGHDEDGDDEEGHDHDHGDHDGHDEDEVTHEMEEAMWNFMFQTADMNADEMLDEDELDQLVRAVNGDYFDSVAASAVMFMISFDTDEDGVLSLEEFESAMSMEDGDDGHDDHWDPNTCHDEDTHETHDEYTNKEDCEAAGHMWMDEDDHDDHDHDSHDDDHGDDHDGHDEIGMMFNMSDANGDGSLDAEEFTSMMEMMGDSDHEEGVAFIGFHVEEEGDYGFALPEGVELHILSMGGHEGHDHGDHDDDHGDDHDDHGDEDALGADPHSWLDPLAYKAQVALVLAELKKEFPDLEDTFDENAMAFMASLDKVHLDYEAAFGSNGTCTNRTVAANHNAYSYIAYRYNLKFVTVHGLDPEGEPSAEDILEVVEKIEEDEINVLFIEEYTDETAVNSIVDETDGDVSIEILYTMELPPKDSSDDYLSLMQKNLNSLKSGLGC